MPGSTAERRVKGGAVKRCAASRSRGSDASEDCPSSTPAFGSRNASPTTGTAAQAPSPTTTAQQTPLRSGSSNAVSASSWRQGRGTATIVSAPRFRWTLRAGACAAVLVSAICLIGSGPQDVKAQVAAYDNPGPVPLDPTVMVLGMFDWLPYDPAAVGPMRTSRCTDSVNKAVKFGNTRINFVPTHYWVDQRSDGTVDSFCYMDATYSTCAPFTKEAIKAFRDGMELCFQRAIDLGMDISLVPHLDDGGKSSAWRNGLVFSPTQKYGGFSYHETMLKPLAEALAATITPKTRVWLAMQGEMSATIMRYPMAYNDLVPELVRLITARLNPKPLPGYIKIGISFNFNKLDTANGDGVTAGSATRRGIGTGSFVSALFGAGGLMSSRRKMLGDQVLGPRQKNIDYPSLMVLFNTVDFIGISSYAALAPDFDMYELQNAAFQFFQEFANVGIDLASIIQERGIEFHYSEYGLGAGISVAGNKPARTAAEAAHTPFYGVWGPYDLRVDPYRTPQVREFMRSFYKRTMEWLWMGGGPTYPIRACFLWGMGSWDILATSAESTTKDGTYYDPVVGGMITAHNARVAAATLQRAGTGKVQPVLRQAAEAEGSNRGK